MLHVRAALVLRLTPRMKRNHVSALEGAGVLQDRFEKAGKPALLLFSAPRLVSRRAVPGEFRALGAEGAGGYPGRAGRPGVEFFRVLGGDGGRGSFWESRNGGPENQRRVLNGEGAGVSRRIPD